MRQNIRHLINYFENFLTKIQNLFLDDIPEKPLAVVIASYNNAMWYKKNLDSVFAQKYNNYRIIYLDDNSSDGTAQLVEKYLKENNQNRRTTLIKNAVRKGATANRYYGSHLCHDDEIVFILDGDDWFAHNKVFQVINNIYSKQDVWLTYGQFRRWPNGIKGQCKKLTQDTNFRKMDKWYTSHLRTYYAWLFKKIKKEDLLYSPPNHPAVPAEALSEGWEPVLSEGEGRVEGFYQIAGDVAEMLPLLEMARGHIKFIPQVLYIYNVATPLNDFKLNLQKQLEVTEAIKAKGSYSKFFKSADPSTRPSTSLRTGSGCLD